MSPAVASPDHEVAVIGAGLSGIGAAIKLQRAGIDDFVLLERADDIGGTWRDNEYPGLAVDLPSFSYQFSFDMNPDWSRVFAAGSEVKAYADRLVDKHGLRSRLQLETNVRKAVFDERNHLWRLYAGRRVIKCRFVLTAVGGFGDPKDPDIPGLGEFAGKTMHTARWDKGHNLTGERVGIIGTGATAVQLVPLVARDAEQLHVFQRTPIWVFPKVDPEIPALVRLAFRRLPLLQSSIRLGAAALVEGGMVVGVVYNRQFPQVTAAIERLGRAWIRAQVRDPELREKLTPSYGFGCKRPSMSNEYFTSFNRDNVELVTDTIQRITPAGIRTVDGEERELDTLILATGYQTTEPENAPSIPVIGRGGEDLGERWQRERFKAYEGVSGPGFPNAFMTFGPYAFSGSSWMFMVENTTTHAIRVIEECRRRGATLVEVRQEPHDEFFEMIQRRQQNTVFFNNNCGGANSYYFDKHGDAPFLRPSTALEAWWRARRFDLDHYRYESLDGELAAAA